MDKSGKLLSAKSIESDFVRNTAGEDVGRIIELMINSDTGKIEYAVLSLGTFIVTGDKYYAVPWEAMSIDCHNQCLVIDEDSTALQNAPAFDLENWPDLADPSFVSSLRGHCAVMA